MELVKGACFVHFGVCLLQEEQRESRFGSCLVRLQFLVTCTLIKKGIYQSTTKTLTNAVTDLQGNQTK